MINQLRTYRVHWLFALLTLAMLATACGGRIRARLNEPLPTLVPQAEPPTETDPALIPATFTPPAAPAAIEIEAGGQTETAVDQTSPAVPAAVDTAVPAPTQEPPPAMSAETEDLFGDMDNLLNQIDGLNSDDLPDLP